MRLPIAYTPINCLLIVMMILSPWIGKKTKEHLQSKHETMQIEKIKKSLLANKQTKENPSKKRRKKLKKRSSKKLMAKTPLATPKKPVTLISNEPKFETPKEKETKSSNEKQFLLGESRVIELNNQTNESLKQSEKLALSQVEKPISSPKTKKHYMRKIRDYAVNKDYLSAESVFLEMLESQDITLSPLDSLEKLDQFKSKFDKLSNSLSKN